MKNKKGFTLVELIVVLAILAVLLAIAVPTAFGSIERSKDKAVTASISNIKGAIDVAHGLTFTSPELQKLLSQDQLAIIFFKNGKLERSGTVGIEYENYYLDSLNKSAIQFEKNAFVSIAIKENPSLNVYEVYITYSKEGYTGTGINTKANFPYYQYTSVDDVYKKFTAEGVSEVID